jgi:hypothetical protein
LHYISIKKKGGIINNEEEDKVRKIIITIEKIPAAPIPEIALATISMIIDYSIKKKNIEMLNL